MEKKLKNETKQNKAIVEIQLRSGRYKANVSGARVCLSWKRKKERKEEERKVLGFDGVWGHVRCPQGKVTSKGGREREEGGESGLICRKEQSYFTWGTD